MKLFGIELINFRCFAEKNFNFGDNLNIIFGPNAVGKTSLLEAVHVLGLTKSNPTNNDQDMIQNGKDYFLVKGFFNKGEISDTVLVCYSGKGKQVKRNNEIFRSLGEYIGFFNAVSFAPSDLITFFGASSKRRREFDMAFCQLSKQFLYWSTIYNRLLKERNVLLKTLSFDDNVKTKKLLEVIDQRLIEAGERVIQDRQRYLKQLNLILKRIHKQIAEQEELKINYHASCSLGNYDKSLKANFENDIKRGSTSVGPHRDNFVLTINDKDLCVYGSQGQQRNAVLSIKLALVELIYQTKGEYPILLLDDVFSELDKIRQNQLIKTLNKYVQTIITTATLSDIDKGLVNQAKLIELKEGGGYRDAK